MKATPWSVLTAFQWNVLIETARLDHELDDPPHGLAIKERLQAIYEEVNHGRLYPNLDDLVEKGYIEKGQRDRRTNWYAPTEAGEDLLRTELDRLEDVIYVDPGKAVADGGLATTASDEGLEDDDVDTEGRVLNICNDCSFLVAEQFDVEQPTRDSEITTAAAAHYHQTDHDTFAGGPVPDSELMHAWEVLATHGSWDDLESSSYYFALATDGAAPADTDSQDDDGRRFEISVGRTAVRDGDEEREIWSASVDTGINYQDVGGETPAAALRHLAEKIEDANDREGGGA